ncbi:hypothetical protein ACHWQZ_G004031 [Mnemiopsis leidyi]
MGVSFVLHWYPPSNQTSSQAEEALLSHLKNIGASVKQSQWWMDCEQFTALPNLSALSGRSFQVIHTSENESLSFAITEQTNVLVSERSFDTILTKMSDCYQPNKLTRIEAKGKKFEIGDFSIKVGSVSLGPNFKCLVMEVEYKPSSYTKDTLPLLHEFLSIVCSNLVPVPENLNQITTPTNSTFYQLSDTILQYKRVFDECRRVNPNLAMN